MASRYSKRSRQPRDAASFNYGQNQGPVSTIVGVSNIEFFGAAVAGSFLPDLPVVVIPGTGDEPTALPVAVSRSGAPYDYELVTVTQAEDGTITFTSMVDPFNEGDTVIYSDAFCQPGSPAAADVDIGTPARIRGLAGGALNTFAAIVAGA